MSELNFNQIGSTVAYDAVTIEDGETLSTIIDIGGFKLCGLFVPTAFAGTTLKFKVSHSETAPASSLSMMRNADGTDYTVTVAAPAGADPFSFIKLPVADFAGVKHIALLAGTAQAADVEIVLAGTLV